MRIFQKKIIFDFYYAAINLMFKRKNNFINLKKKY